MPCIAETQCKYKLHLWVDIQVSAIAKAGIAFYSER